MYQALYRKWRPQTFDEVIGQKHITQTLKNQVQTGRLSHAYIFIGTRGTGKTSCARILARAVNCESPVEGNPCGICPACRGIIEGSVLDVVELDAASNNGVDNVRALRDEAVFSPASVKKRVYIIDEVHMLSTPAFNALLKILEEPPEHLLFVLATTELQKVPATILSRCQRHSFRRIDTAEIADYLKYIAKEERLALSDEAALLVARLAEGGVRDALSLLDQCSASERIDVDTVCSAMGLAGNRRIEQLLGSILSHDTETALSEFSGMWIDGKDPATLLDELNSLMRDVLMMHVAPKGGLNLISGGHDTISLKDLARRITVEELICAMGTVQGAIASLRDVKNTKTAVELCLISLCDNTAGDSPAQLRARISRLEEELERGVQPGKLEYTRREAEDDEPQDAAADISDEDEIELFREEQPEDDFFKRDDSPTAIEDAPPAEAVADNTDGLWSRICEAVLPGLAMDMRANLSDETKVRGRIDGATLLIEVVPGFLYNRFNRQDVLAKFADAGREIVKQPMKVQLKELQMQTGARSLEELKQFKEVRFI